MREICHTFTIKASADKVFEGISSPEYLDKWWSKNSQGTVAEGQYYQLDFGPQYLWKARITKCRLNAEFELQMTDADAEWTDTKIGFILTHNNNSTRVDFYHTGWREKTDNYKYSSYCWAMYLRILKNYLESGKQVSYEKRLSD